MRHSSLFLVAISLLGSPVRAEEGMSLVEQKLLSADAATRVEGAKQFALLKERDKQETLTTLIDALASGPSMAMRAAPALAEIAPSAKKAIPYLVEGLRYDDEEVYREMAKALQKIGPSTIPLLVKAFDDSNFFVRRRSAEIVGTFGPAAQSAVPGLFELWQDQTYEVQKAAEASLLKIGAPAVGWLGRNFSSHPDETRKNMITLLGKFGTPAISYLSLFAQQDRNSYIRAASASQLGTIHPTRPEAVKALLVALADGEEWVRVESAQALGELGPSASLGLGQLIVAAYADRDALVQRRARDSAQQIRPASQEAFQGLMKAYQNTDAEIRLEVIQALKNSAIAPASIQTILRSALQDSDSAVKQAAQELQAELAKKEPVKPAPAASTAVQPSSVTVSDVQKSTDTAGDLPPAPEKE